MRKLINFYRICYCYLVLFVYFVLFCAFYYFSMFIFLFIDASAFNDVMGNFAKEFEKIVTNKIDKIKKYEFDLLN